MGFTKQQQDAIDARGRVIVSASAGSGKTTVMIERIIQLILSGVGVDEILAVTFTKKAAAQMKEKLSNALIKNINAAESTPERRETLKKQLAKVNGADISTIDSFCARVLRSHFYATDVDNAFRVIDSKDAEGVALKNQAIDEMLEEGYAAKKPEEMNDEEREKKAAFFHLLSVYWRKKSDKAFREIFLKKYDDLRSNADYEQYLDKSKRYDKGVFDSVCRDLYTRFKQRCVYYRDLIEKEHGFFQAHYQATTKEVIVRGKTVIKEGECKNQLMLTAELALWLTELCAAPDYFAMRAVGMPSFTQNRGGKNQITYEHIERLKFLRERVLEGYKDEFGKLGDYRQELEKFMLSAKTAAALATYFLEFDNIYKRLKRERGVLDYNDLEHKALALLEKKEISQEMQAKYRYVFVDEYQDVNSVQDRIVEAVSGKELFLVGDMKQAIYGFRGSSSTFFDEKFSLFKQSGTALEFPDNFRSTGKVLDAVNRQFKLSMPKYTPMIKGNDKYAADSGKVRVHFCGKEVEEKENERGVYSVRDNMLGERKTESRMAMKIRQIIDHERAEGKIFDVRLGENGEFRPVEYKDIAVLSRNKQGEISRTVAALADTGLPVSSASAVNICEFAEIKTLMDILSLLDNAEQDIPLCSALLSAMGDLTVDDLTEIRLAYPNKKHASFRSVCRQYAAENTGRIAEKLQAFYAYYAQMRTLSRVMGAGELLSKILSETGMEARLLALENGGGCLRRIRRFLEEASLPEPLSVSAFLERLKNLDNKILYSENGGEDAVKVLTMHSSKGLEYPIVILENLSAPFHAPDSDEVVLEKEYGLAPRAFDEDKMCKNSTVLRRLYTVKEKENSIADELNLYYVAMTRAEHTLHMVFTEKTEMSDAKYGRSFAELTDFSAWDEEYFNTAETDVVEPATQPRQVAPFRPNENLAQEIIQAFRWQYAHAGYENLPVKSSATALVGNVPAPTPETAENAFGATESWRQEYFDEAWDDVDDGNETNLSADDKTLGIAYHAFLENFDFSLLYDENGIPMSALNVENAIKQELSSGAAGYELLSMHKLKEILANPVFKELLGARLYKERQFLVSLPVLDTYAKRADFDKSALALGQGEEIIFQGAIDLLAVSDNVRIIDYKYSARGDAYLRAHYKPQLDLYRLAVAKILGVDKEKIRCTIINIRRGTQVDMD